MSLKSQTTRYGSMAMAIHWLTAIAIFGMLRPLTVHGIVARC